MLAVTCFLLCCLYFIWRQRPKGCYPSAEYPIGLSVSQQALMFMGHRVNAWHLINILARRCYLLGGVMAANVGFRKIYVVTDPQKFSIISSERKTADRIFNKSWFSTNTRILMLKNKYRNMISPILSQVAVDNHMSVFNKQSTKLMEQLDMELEKRSLEHLEYLKLHALETLSSTTLGLNLGLMLKYQNNSISSKQPLFSEELKTIFSWKVKKKDYLYKKILRMSSFLVLKRKFKSDLCIDPTLPDDFQPLRLILQRSLQSKYLNNRELKDISEQVVNLVEHGADAVGSALLFTLVLLGSHKEVQEKVFQELRENLNGIYIHAPDILKLKYLDAVVKESMRMYSVLPVLTRTIDKEIQLDKLVLEPGTTCYFISRDHHDPFLWGLDVNDFNPDRWLQGKHHDLQAFGVGSHTCLGQNYAMTLMKTTLVHLLRTYKVSADLTVLKLQFDYMLTPASGHLIRISRRN